MGSWHEPGVKLTIEVGCRDHYGHYWPIVDARLVTDANFVEDSLVVMVMVGVSKDV